jgi:hypothetical protein
MAKLYDKYHDVSDGVSNLFAISWEHLNKQLENKEISTKKYNRLANNLEKNQRQ